MNADTVAGAAQPDALRIASHPASSSVPSGPLVAAVLGTALAYMSDDMLNVAIPSVARELAANVTDVQWILDAYYVSLVSCVLVAGSVGDIVGHRRVFVTGIGLFSAGAIVSAVAPAVPILVVGRFIQGVAAALLLTGGLALVSRSSRPDARTRSVATFFGLVAAVPALGPFLSGTLVDLLSWRALFVVPLVLPLAALIVTWARVPETPRAHGRRADVAGAALAFLTLGAFSVGLILGAGDPAAPVALATLGVAVMGGLAFVVVERRAADPMLPLRFFRRRRFLGGNLVWLLGCLTSWGAVFFVAVTLQATLGLRPLAAGLVLTPIYLVMMVGSPLAGRLSDRVGPHAPILGGLVVYAGGLLLLGSIGPKTAVVPDVLAAVLAFAGGMALFTAPLASVTLGALDEADQGVASGVNTAMGQLAGLLGVVILPAAAGLAGVSLGSPEFAVGHARALLSMAWLAVAAIPLAAWALRSGPVR